MDIFEKIGITPYINAHDTYTVYGGSRMAENTIEAMREISKHFVDFDELQMKVGKKIAEMTNNEAAYVTNGSAGAIQLAAAVCMVKGNAFHFMRLPACPDIMKRMIVMRGQHNAYDKAIEEAGGEIVFIGDADETLEVELEGELKKGAAAVFFFAPILFERASMPLERVIAISHRYGVPVVVDAAAQIPPKENLWKYTRDMGADMAIFSGGKTLSGPQDSGLIVGREKYIKDCLRFGAPNHGVCRSSKTSRESVVGLYVALENYLNMDSEAESRRIIETNEKMARIIGKAQNVRLYTVDHGPVGQTYQRLFIELTDGRKADDAVKYMRDRGIYIGKQGKDVIYLSALNLLEDEAVTVANALCDWIK
ncbi:MAG: aminotransferase class V-fold PLP-dependent enzyme [Clostridia bacterium]|nr:aminotransferase class V-fold PLP-dependent enzyme [Clostridia bacterium]